jgi:hypothetical protein
MTATAGRTAYAAGPPGSPRSSAVMVAGLRKSYGAVQAVRGTSFAVDHEKIFAGSTGKTSACWPGAPQEPSPPSAASAGAPDPNDRKPYRR